MNTRVIFIQYTVWSGENRQSGSCSVTDSGRIQTFNYRTKNLNSNIKHYIDELTKHSTVAEIMDALFNDYITNIVDKAYHRLLTSDNVSKFRPEIIERLESKSRSQSYIEKGAGRACQPAGNGFRDGKEKCVPLSSRGD